MEAKANKKGRSRIETVKSWFKREREIEISIPMILLFYFQAYIVSNHIWNPTVPIINKLFAITYLFSTFFLTVYAQKLIPQDPEETAQEDII